MSKIDRIKEELGWLKLFLVYSLLLMSRLLLGLLKTMTRTSSVLIVFGFIAVVILTFVVVWLNRTTMKRFKELEEE